MSIIRTFYLHNVPISISSFRWYHGVNEWLGCRIFPALTVLSLAISAQAYGQAGGGGGAAAATMLSGGLAIHGWVRRDDLRNDLEPFEAYPGLANLVDRFIDLAPDQDYAVDDVERMLLCFNPDSQLCSTDTGELVTPVVWLGRIQTGLGVVSGLSHGDAPAIEPAETSEPPGEPERTGAGTGLEPREPDDGTKPRFSVLPRSDIDHLRGWDVSRFEREYGDKLPGPLDPGSIDLTPQLAQARIQEFYTTWNSTNLSIATYYTFRVKRGGEAGTTRREKWDKASAFVREYLGYLNCDDF